MQQASPGYRCKCGQIIGNCDCGVDIPDVCDHCGARLGTCDCVVEISEEHYHEPDYDPSEQLPEEP